SAQRHPSALFALLQLSSHRACGHADHDGLLHCYWNLHQQIVLPGAGGQDGHWNRHGHRRALHDLHRPAPSEQPQAGFQGVPRPLRASISLFVNIIMLTQLTAMTWIRLAGWMTIGLAIYLIYGMRHSKEELRYKKEQ
ncbi:hypothetical protein PENTCL1PPCAC_5244, partial [Pristionchus entomophagus]